MGTEAGAKLVSLSDVIGAERDQPSIANLDFAM